MREYILRELKIEVTHNCPLSCVHCSSSAHPNNRLSMTLEMCAAIIGGSLSIGVKDISFSGGEPLVWEGIVEAVSYAKKAGLSVNIYTTGICEHSNEMISALANAGVDKLIFSLYSDNSIEHNRVTRKAGSFDYTLKSIGVAQSLGILTEIHFVALASNYKKLAGIAELSHDIGVKKVSVLRFVPQGRGLLISSTDSLNKGQNLELKQTIVDLRKKGFEIRTGSPFNVLHLNENPKCMAAQDRLIVSPNLNIYPCDAFKQISSETISPDDAFSNLGNNSISECWKHSNYLKLVREAILDGPTEPCLSCSSYKMCLSGCLAQKYLFHSSLNKNPDPACIVRSVD